MGLWTETHSNTQVHLDHTQTHTRVCGVCTCERILSAGPSFSPMVLSRCSSVSSGNVSPSMACSRNTWQRHSRFSHSPDIHTHTQTYTFIHTTYKNSGSIPKCNTHFERKNIAENYHSTFLQYRMQLWRKCCLMGSATLSQRMGSDFLFFSVVS